MKQPENEKQKISLIGYFAIPHELLHVAGYRLVGYRCDYRWGQTHVTPRGPMALRERLIGGLLPFSVFMTVFLGCTALSGLAYHQFLHDQATFDLIFWTGLALLFGVYVGTTVDDLRQSYLLILDKPWPSWTPFDIFYWPVIDWAEVRKEAGKKRHDQQS